MRKIIKLSVKQGPQGGVVGTFLRAVRVCFKTKPEKEVQVGDTRKGCSLLNHHVSVSGLNERSLLHLNKSSQSDWE